MHAFGYGHNNVTIARSKEASFGQLRGGFLLETAHMLPNTEDKALDTVTMMCKFYAHMLPCATNLETDFLAHQN